MADFVSQRISELTESEDFSNLYTLGYSVEGGVKQSRKIPLNILQETKDIADTLPTKLEGKADLDTNKKYIKDTQLNPLSGYQTGMITGKGIFKTDNSNVIFKDKPHTTMLAFVIPQDIPSLQVVYNEGNSGENIYGLYIYLATNRTAVAVMRGTTVCTKVLPYGSLCFVALSYTPDGQCLARINGTIKDSASIEYKYEHNPVKINIGGQESGTNSKNPLSLLFFRTFNFAMTAEQLDEAWNNGHPELWRVPDTLRNGVEGQKCVLDLNPHGLLPTIWRDTSGNGNDVPYVPFSENPAECELSYENHGFKDIIIGTAAPTVTPDFIGQKFIDTTNKVTYTAYGTTNAGDWKQ